MWLPKTIQRLRREESGQSLIMVCVSMVVLLCVCALVVDLARAMDVQRQLQTSADAAAMAAAENLPSTDYATYGSDYTSSTGSKNAFNGIKITSSSIAGKCLQTVVGWGIPCSSSQPNAVQVTQTASINTYFAGIMGIKTMNISATSTASKGRPIPYNIALIIDTTPSMSDSDSSCGSGQTQLGCALQGAQTLLSSLDPSLDYVSLFTFPNFPVNNAQDDYNCSGQSPTPSSAPNPYIFPVYNATTLSSSPWYTYTTKTTGSGRNQKTTTVQNETDETYQVVGFKTDYKTSDTSSTLNSSSDLVKAVGGVSKCSSMQTGYNDTYYAGAVYQAESALLAEQASRGDGSENVIIFLSDGNATASMNSPNTGTLSVVGSVDWNGAETDMATNDTADDGSTTNTANMTSQYNGATNSGTYPSYVGQCGQGIDAANYATKEGTTVITVSYGSPTTSSGSGYKSNSGNCGSDVNAGNHRNVSPCTSLEDMATNFTNGNTEYFFSDDYVSGKANACKAPTSANNGSLQNVFSLISVTLSNARLIPNATT